MDLNFKPIQTRHLSLAYAFLKEAFAISFGANPSRWPNNLGNLMENNYVEIIKKKLTRDPSSVIHVWLNEHIVGQIETSVKKEDPECGYVSLYYLIPQKRRMGLGTQLDNFASERLSKLGCKRVELTVEPSNIPAFNFYQKHGWISKGLHPSYRDGILMVKSLTDQLD